MKVVDMTKEYLPQWQDTLNLIKNSEDLLKHNYTSINFNDFLTFTCLLNDQEEIVCFSGLQYDETKWGGGIGRISSRMWIHPLHRFKSLVKFSGGSSFLNTYYCLPFQYAKAKEHKLHTIFVSREDNLNGFKEYVKLIKINCGLDFKVEEQKYYVCGVTRNPSCLQYVARHELNSQSKENWDTNMCKHKGDWQLC